MRRLVLLLFLVPTLSFGNFWGKTGHRVTGHIAEKHLSRKAKKAIDKLLDGNSLAFVSTYADEIKADRSFSKFSSWHYVNYPLAQKYFESKKSEYGDLAQGINDCIAVIKDANSSRADKIFYLKLLVHLVGDLHQPMHVSRAADKGGNDIQVQWFGEGSNLHRVWDTNMIASYGMSYAELGDELDRTATKEERKLIQQGSIIDWLEESHTTAAVVYESVKVGEKLGYSYAYKYNPLLFESLRKGGFRLAELLNEVFE